MSRYSEKKNKPPCAAMGCKEVGKFIVLAGVRPAWFCPDHSEEVKKK